MVNLKHIAFAPPFHTLNASCESAYPNHVHTYYGYLGDFAFTLPFQASGGSAYATHLDRDPAYGFCVLLWKSCCER